MAREVTIFCLWVIVLLIAIAIWAINAGLEKVRHLDSLSRTVRAQRKKISELGSEIMFLKSKLMESRRDCTAFIAKSENLQMKLTITENKLKAANLLIEQTNEKLQRRGKL